MRQMKWSPRSLPSSPLVKIASGSIEFDKRIPIGAAPPQEPVPVAQRKRFGAARLRFDGVPGIRAPDVGSNRATSSLAIVVVEHEPVRIGQTLVIPVRRKHQGRPARPAADHFGGEPIAPLRGTIKIARRLIHEGPESINVLPKLPEHKVAAVAAEIGSPRPFDIELQMALGIEGPVHEGARRIAVVFVLVAQDELARLDAQPGFRLPAEPFDDGRCDSVVKAKMLFLVLEPGGA